jgi:hypothetical protein
MTLTGTTTRPLAGSLPRRAARGTALAGTRLSAVLLLVVVQGVALVVVLLLLVLFRSAAPVPTQVPVPAPQSAPVAP